MVHPMVAIIIIKCCVCQEFVTNLLSSFSPDDTLFLTCVEEVGVVLSTAGVTAPTAEDAGLSSCLDIL